MSTDTSPARSTSSSTMAATTRSGASYAEKMVFVTESR